MLLVLQLDNSRWYMQYLTHPEMLGVRTVDPALTARAADAIRAAATAEHRALLLGAFVALANNDVVGFTGFFTYNCDI